MKAVWPRWDFNLQPGMLWTALWIRVNVKQSCQPPCRTISHRYSLSASESVGLLLGLTNSNPA